MISASQVDVFNIASLTGSMPLSGMAFAIPVTFTGTTTQNAQKTGLAPLRVYRFTGLDYTSSGRYPQGVATYGNFVLTSFYYKYAPLQAACKLVVLDRASLLTANVGLAQYDAASGLYKRIDTHAGGIEVFGDYLYVEDSFTQTLHVFDLRAVYPKIGNNSVYDTTDPFFAEVDYLLPEVGRIQLSWNGNTITNTSFVSKSDENSIVLGNFWIPGSQYAAGGKSMVWRLPMQLGAYPFKTPPIGVVAEQFEPIFPTGSLDDTGLSVDKIQGALLRPNNVLMLSRSYGSGTKQLMILTPNPAVFYNGNTTNPLGYDWKNWLYGCEDMSTTEDGNEVVTVTEFNGFREISFWAMNDLLGLVGDYQPPTIAEHEAALAALLAELQAKQQEAAYYDLQINSAVAQNLERFDRLTFVP